MQFRLYLQVKRSLRNEEATNSHSLLSQDVNQCSLWSTKASLLPHPTSRAEGVQALQVVGKTVHEAIHFLMFLPFFHPPAETINGIIMTLTLTSYGRLHFAEHLAKHPQNKNVFDWSQKVIYHLSTFHHNETLRSVELRNFTKTTNVKPHGFL